MSSGTGKRDLIWVSLHLKDGGELPFVLDTGAPFALLDTSLIPKLGRTIGSQDVNSLYGLTPSRFYKAPNLYWGDVRLRAGNQVGTMDLNWLFRDLTRYSQTNHHAMGILGMDSLWHYCIQLDFAGRKVRFLGPSQVHPQELGQVYKLSRVPAGDWEGCPVVAGVRDWRCMIDTGLLGQSATNVLGLNFLSRYLVTLDFPDKKMYLKSTNESEIGELSKTQPNTGLQPGGQKPEPQKP